MVSNNQAAQMDKLLEAPGGLWAEEGLHPTWKHRRKKPKPN